MGMGFAPTCFRQVSPLLHTTTLTTAYTLKMATATDGIHSVQNSGTTDNTGAMIIFIHHQVVEKKKKKIITT